jgi:hypothetical protein
MSSRNITLSLPNELVRRAKVVAAQRDTSVSAMVGELLASAVGDVQDDDQLWAEEERVMQAGLLRIGDITWSRDDIHARASG